MARSSPSVYLCLLAICGMFGAGAGDVAAQATIPMTVQTAKPRQVYDGVGAGAIFYEGHITSLAARDRTELQQQLYDDMFTRIPTRYLQLMIREVHEPQNDNDDPYTPAFDDKNFEYCKHAIQIAEAALKRQPDIQLYATLYTPPPWMKTNNDVTAGGESRATIKAGFELEVCEYAWAFLEKMQRHGVPVQYLSIANEPDWPHTQPGYCLSPERNAALLKVLNGYLDKMARKYPAVPRPKLVGPNTLSAPGAASDYLPPVLKPPARLLDVIGAHDYDPRGDRWGVLRKLAGNRPVWVTEWCARDKDATPGMIRSATEYGVKLHEAFQGGVNVFLAYDWVYPPIESGEALIHVDWGHDYKLTKPYHLLRQWAEPLSPGMRVVDISDVARAGQVKPTAFLSKDARSLVVHVVNAQDQDASIAIKLTGKFGAATTALRTRTSGTEDVVELADLTGAGGRFADSLPARSMVTYRVSAPVR